MLVIGLTGSIGMGKSTAAARLRALGFPVFDSDAEVHRLYAGQAVPAIEEAFPGVTHDGAVDRAALSARLMAEPSRFEQLEAIVHPMVRAAQRAFLRDAAGHGEKGAVLEVPLLFEIGLENLLDVTIVVSAPAEIQKIRVLARPGMTEEKLAGILARQLSDAEKRRRADFIVDTSGSITDTHAAIDKVVSELGRRVGTAFARHWS